MRNEYQNRVWDAKKSLLTEMSTLLGKDNLHVFKNPVCVHYIEEEVASNEYCRSVHVWNDGSLTFLSSEALFDDCRSWNDSEGDELCHFDIDSLSRVLDALRYELSQKPVAEEIDKKKAWEFYDKVASPSLFKQTKSTSTNIKIYYEVYIDLQENWVDGEKLYLKVKDMTPDEIGKTLYGYVCEREEYYRSPRYARDLNEMLKGVVFHD